MFVLTYFSAKCLIKNRLIRAFKKKVLTIDDFVITLRLYYLFSILLMTVVIIGILEYAMHDNDVCLHTYLEPEMQ